jgi:hypothetical protein
MAAGVRAPRVAAANDPLVRRLADDGINVGLTAWTEPSLVDSGEFYPLNVTPAEDRLRFYASRLPITQVDSTSYHHWRSAPPPCGRRGPRPGSASR